MEYELQYYSHEKKKWISETFSTPLELFYRLLPLVNHKNWSLNTGIQINKRLVRK
jgi:hypothetical protein